jgi:hypothetical protein
MPGGAVVAVGARGEALAGQTAGKGHQLALPGGRLKVHRGLTALAAFTPISHLRPDFKPGGLHLPWALTLVAVGHKIDQGPCRPSRKTIKQLIGVAAVGPDCRLHDRPLSALTCATPAVDEC